MSEATPTAPAPPPPPQSEAEKEDALDRMLTRLALADDDRLEPLLSSILPYTISSLSSSSPSVRDLVMKILTHVNRRVKHRLEIGLPMLELWKLYCEANTSPMVRNFCTVYLEMAFERLPDEKKMHISPELLVNVSTIPSQHQGIILRMISKAIGFHSSKIDEFIASKYKAVSGSRDGDVFVEFCLHVILYQSTPPGMGSPPGLSIAQAERVSGKQPVKSEALAMRKLGILNVIEVMKLRPEAVYPIYLAAASDSLEPVVKRGEDLLKRGAPGVNLEDSDLIRRLFMLFNGTPKDEKVANELKVAPASTSLRARLMSVFTKSIAAANAFPFSLQCIFGCIYGDGTTSRLKQLGMEFTVWVFKHAALDQLKLMGPVILSGVLRSLDGSSGLEADTAGRDLKVFAYQAIGLLASRVPNLFREKSDMAVRLFMALRLEDQSLRLAIQEVASSLATAYKGAPEEVLKELEALLLQNCQAEQTEVRFCALRWATSLFDLHHCPSRYICMLGASDTRLDIREMALEGLNLLKDERQLSMTNTGANYPDLKLMLDFIATQQPELLDSTAQREGRLHFPSKSYLAMVKFLMKCFEASQRKELLEKESEVLLIEKMGILIEKATGVEGSNELHATALRALVDISSHFPKLVASCYSLRLSWLKSLLSHIDSDTREAASRVIGLSCALLSSVAASDLISEFLSLISRNQKIRFETFHGSICAIGFVTAECMKESSFISEELYRSIIEALVKVVESETAPLASAAMEALGHIGLRTLLPVITRDSITAGVLIILQERLAKLLSGNEIKCMQKILVSLGHISFNETSFPHLQSALDLIFGMSRSKVEDVLFSAGEALSFIWGDVPVTADMVLKTNYGSLSERTNYLTSEMQISSLTTSDRSVNDDESHIMAREVIIKKLFETLLYSSRKEERCAGTVWLVSLTMYCGHHKRIQELLPEIQEAFSHLIGDQNDLTQDLASQGMSIVYELGDASMKQELVHALVGTLTGTGKRKRAIKLTEDSEVFQEGSIGKDLGGGKLSTYKELCSLANEMGQPDLIYKFMDLANYQASLNSKRGAAFGFSKIAKQAGEALQPHLKSLIPRLVRYQYDPDKNVQDAMAHIWKSIVADSKKTIDEYYDIIMDDLLMQCGSRLWRSREASCLAIADLIQGRRFSQVGKHLKRIWTAAFRAMDDIKETVRKSGDSLCRAVSSLTVRLCDISLTEASDARHTMDMVLPYLLVEGIVSKVSSVQKASIGIVMKLAKGAGITLRPHLPDLVCCMLECLSSLEDQRLNYVELHAANVGIQAEKLEGLRIAVAKDSPMWETLDVCLKVVDTESLTLLVPRLAQMVKSGVGLNTRFGVASFITMLAQKVNADIKPFTNTLLKTLFHAVLDEKSSSVKRAFASSCAVILKYASQAQAQKLIEDTTALHLGEKNAQVSGAVLLRAYYNNAAEVLSGYNAVIIPVTFVSRFEDDKDISALFEELWEEIPSGERITLQLYLEEVVSLLCDCMASSSWGAKRKSAKAMRKLSEVLKEMLVPHQNKLLSSLLKELPGRLWEGKDLILHAVASVCSSCHDALTEADPTTPTNVLAAVSNACTKKAKSYREAAFSCLQQVISAFKNPEFFNLVFPMLYEICKKDSAKNFSPSPVISSNAGTDEAEDTSAPMDKVLDCFSSCFHVSSISDLLNKKEQILEVISIALSSSYNWPVKMSAFSSIKELSLKFSTIPDDSCAYSHDGLTFVCKVVHSVGPLVLDCIRSVKIAQVHIAASECLLEMSKLYRNVPLEHKMDVSFKDDLTFLCESEKNEQAKTLLRECISILL
ncbi:proteasome-associated protein ECM29 isoform X1 [Carex littledalei]|uniref:Proteasome-associated protein ECM29 isoform X1 n=1 Tax=Carex littledalei TaxID=544730 RepID=A0A833QZA7_9POAL|nr:proteasome-associated protein ECM29 isoform X1 [Carex littledalei]